MNDQPKPRHPRSGEEGFLLVGVIVMAALVLIALSVAMPVIAKDLKREKELEAMHRGQQYVRAIRMFYQKNNAYPASVKALESTNNVRYLRQHYLDPMTGKDDWKLIGLGQAKTTVKGFFGQPLSGLNGAAGGGLGSASGLQSGGIGNTGGTTGGVGGQTGTASGSDPSGTGSAFGNTPGTGVGAGNGTGTSGFGTSSFGQNGKTGGSDSAFGSGSTGPFVGVGIPKEGASIITLNEQTDYSKWEFIYDPRIEQLYAKSSIFGGGIASSTGGLGSASSLNGTPGANNGPGTGPAKNGINDPSSYNPNDPVSTPNPGGTNPGGTTTPPIPPTTTPQ